MDYPKRPGKRHFTEAARAAAVEGRRLAQERRLPHGTPELFIVRRPPESLNFGWEIRRFGAVLIEKSQGGFPTMEAAMQAGETALAGQGPEA